MLNIKKMFHRGFGFIKDLLEAIRKDDIAPYAHQLTLSLILAFFPFVMFLFTLVGFFNLDASAILDTFKRVLPQSVYPFLSEIVIDIVDRQRGGLLSLSIGLAIYSASGGFRAFMKSSNRVTGLEEKRNILIRYLLSIVWVVLFALTIVVVLVTLGFGKQILSLLDESLPRIPLSGLIHVLRLVVPLVMTLLVLTLFYMHGPSERIPFKYALPGSVFTTVVWALLTFAFQYYVDNMANYSRFYGAIGALIALLIWLQLISTILLIGVEINAVRMTRHGIALSGTNAENS